MQKVKKRR